MVQTVIKSYDLRDLILIEIVFMIYINNNQTIHKNGSSSMFCKFKKNCITLLKKLIL